MQAYSDPTRESDPYALPNVEVFYLGADDFIQAEAESVQADMMKDAMADRDDYSAKSACLCAADLDGWYYWFCFPGCLPDSDPVGPFPSEAKALTNAQRKD